MPEISPPAPGPLEPQPATTTGLASNVAAGIACIFTLIGGIVFIVLEKRDRFVRFWAMQSIFFGGVALAASVVFKIASLVFGFIPIVGKLLLLVLWLANLAFGVAWFVVYLISIVKAFSKQEWEIPWLGGLARKQLEQMDGPRADPPAA